MNTPPTICPFLVILSLANAMSVSRQIDSRTPFVSDIKTLPSDETELPIIIRASVLNQYRDTDAQVMTAYLQGNALHSTQLLSFTSEPTQSPYITRDQQNYLYATWLERGEDGFSVYFASTTPAIKENFAQINRADVVYLSREVSFGLMSGMVLTPLWVSVWLFAPGVVLAITSFLRNQEKRYWKWGDDFFNFARYRHLQCR